MLHHVNNNLQHYVMMCKDVPTMCTDVQLCPTLLHDVTMKCTSVARCYK